MKTMFRPEECTGLSETYEFRVDDEVVHVRVHDGSLEVSQGNAASPDLIVTSDICRPSSRWGWDD